MKRICNCGSDSWRWGEINSKPTLFCSKCNEPATNDVFSAEEVGQKLGVSRNVIIKLVLTQKLEAACIGKQYRVTSSNLQEYITRNTIKHVG